MSDWVLLIVGLLVGGAVAWLAASGRAAGTIAELRSQIGDLRSAGEGKDLRINELQKQLAEENAQKRETQTSLEQAERSLAEQRESLKVAQQELTNAFDALALKALGASNKTFLELAQSTFEKVQAEAESDLQKRQTAIEGLVKPLKESLDRYERETQEIERSRREAYGALAEQVTSLHKVTASLDIALRTPLVRGRWGELTLHRVVELAGMSAHCDFTEQESLTGETGRQRPDMIVHLAGGRPIAVDAKVPLQSFLDAASAATEEERTAHLARHGQMVRSHMNKLGAKNYWEQFDPSPDFVVLFLPGESFFSAALEQDRTLIEDGTQNRIILATPTTLIALLWAVAYGWRQEQLAQNAQEISDLGKELYDRIRTFTEHWGEMGTALERAVESYNKATGSLERRVLVSARRFKELGAATGEEIMEVAAIEQSPRRFDASEAAGSEELPSRPPLESLPGGRLPESRHLRKRSEESAS